MPLGAKTLSFWLNAPLNNNKYIYGDNGGDWTNHGTALNLQTTPSFCTQSFKGNGAQLRWNFCANVHYNDSLWHQVVLTWDGTTNANTVKFYFDGILITNATASATESTISTRTSVLGTLYDTYTTGGSNISLDEVAIWNRSLSASEISNIYLQQYGRYYHSGNYTSAINDLGTNYSFNNISWVNGSTGANTMLNLSYRSCNDAVCSGESWNNTASSSPFTLDVINNRYFQYKFNFFSDSTNHSTPQLYNVSLGYSLSDAEYPIFSNFWDNNNSLNNHIIFCNLNKILNFIIILFNFFFCFTRHNL